MPKEGNYKIILTTRNNEIFLQLKFSGPGHWSQGGCHFVRSDKSLGIVVCKCDHLTNFAVLMSPAGDVSINPQKYICNTLQND